MSEMSRRSFLKTTAGVAAMGAAVPILSGGWPQLLAAEKPGYFEREFGISDALCQKVLAEALSRGGDFADLYFEHTISNWIILEDGKVSRAFSDVALGVGIRTVKGDQVGYGFTQELNERSMLNAAAIAATIASGPRVKPAAKLSWLETKNYYPLEKPLTAVPWSRNSRWCRRSTKSVLPFRRWWSRSTHRSMTSRSGSWWSIPRASRRRTSNPGIT